VELYNRSRGRLLNVVSVDGVNVITGETAAFHQAGYVLAPGQRYDVNGWRKSRREIAAFEFTSLPRSYAARTGRPDDVGVIGVAVFRENALATGPQKPDLRRSAPVPRATAPGCRASRTAATGRRPPARNWARNTGTANATAWVRPTLNARSTPPRRGRAHPLRQPCEPDRDGHHSGASAAGARLPSARVPRRTPGIRPFLIESRGLTLPEATYQIPPGYFARRCDAP
jgi:hypothetical protein